jgi:hypothetical protein
MFIVLVGVRVLTRDDDTPRRRDLRKLRTERNAAEAALHDIEAKINETPGLDIVGENLAAEIRKIITDHRRKTLENDK